MLKQSVISSFLSKTKDRFHEYNVEKSLEEKFAFVAGLEGVDAVEVVFPYEVSSADELNRLKDGSGVALSAVNVNVKAEPEFRNGGLTSSSEAVRQKAVRFIKEAKDFAAQVGADKVTCCPLGDGYEFSFQADYAQSWSCLVETFGEAATHRPEVPLFIEYKPKETRGRCFVDTAAKALCLIREIDRPSLGVTVDFGHSVYGHENPPEAISLIAHHGVPFYVHANDNDATWDWDYMVGSKNLLLLIEFLYYLQRLGYDDYITADASPTRWDIKRFFEANARWTAKLWNRVADLDRATLETLVQSDDYMDTWAFVEEHILRV